MEDQSDKVTKKSEADKERLFATHNKLTGSIAVLPAVVVWMSICEVEADIQRLAHQGPKCMVATVTCATTSHVNDTRQTVIAGTLQIGNLF